MRVGVAAILLTAAVAAMSRFALAQGLSGASVQVSVAGPTGAPVSSATVTLLNTSTGTTREGVSDANGISIFETVPVGGPYRVTARHIGYQPTSLDDIVLHVGDRIVRQLVLAEIGTLGTVTVRGATLRDPGAGGPAYSITGEDIRNLPLLNRDFVGLFGIAPQATGASLSVSGQHSRFNSIQIDGGAANDFFGTNLTPGAGAGGKAISLEAIEEIRVLVAPFDVRQGGFSGGLINAVTRSGTNTLRGSVFVSNTRSQLVGRDTAGHRAATFDALQYGATVGGPIVRDRLHFFAVADIQTQRSDVIGPVAGDPATGISEATARRASQVLMDTYGIDAGTLVAPTLQQPSSNLFLKLSGQPSRNSWVELSHARLDARSELLNRTIRNRVDRDGWQLSNSGSAPRSKSVTTRIKATSTAGRLTNELIASAGSTSDGIESDRRAPLFLIRADAPTTYIAGGSVKNAQGTETDQRVIELTDNLSWARGSHLLTIGTQNQLLHFHDNFFLGSWGTWTFASLDSLEQRLPFRYEVAVPLRAGGPLADFSAKQIAGYLQDRWTATSRLTLTAGLRVDAPFLDAPPRNPALASNAALGNIDTGDFPDGNAVLSPRLGFGWELGRERRTMLRGGIGGFAGRPPYAWLSGAFSNTGQQQALLICAAADGVPAPTTDIGQLPRQCVNSSPNAQAPAVSFFAPTFHFQQAIKFALGVDHDFDGGVTLSVDAIHTRSRDQLSVNDVNLLEQAANAEGRVTYGAITTAGRTVITTPSRLDNAFRGVYRFGNSSGDRSTSIAGVVQKRWASGGQLQIGYSWSRTEDITSLFGFNGPMLLANNPLDGRLAQRRLRRSARDVPHNVVLTAVVPAWYGITTSFFLRTFGYPIRVHRRR
jgi:hypothetical protein